MLLIMSHRENIIQLKNTRNLIEAGIMLRIVQV